MVAQQGNQSSSMTNTSQPLKLLSSLTSMVNNNSTAGLSINMSVPNTRTQNVATSATTVASAPTSIQPILMQLVAQQQKNKDSLMRNQILEFQKTYAKQLAAAGVKIATSTVPNALQLGSTSLTINTKIPIQTVPSTLTKSAFATTKLKSKLSSAGSTSSNLLNLTQAQVNQLAQQGLILSAKPQQQYIKSQTTSVATHKHLHEQLKGLSPIQRELFIKQYSASAAGKQVQSALGTNTANPALLASILKNRQTVPTAILSPKGVIGSTNTPTATFSTHITPRKGPKVIVILLFFI